MEAIGDLLKKRKIPGVELRETRQSAAAAASALLKFPILPKAVKIKGKTLFFSIPSVMKTELILRQEDLKRMLQTLGLEITAIK